MTTVTDTNSIPENLGNNDLPEYPNSLKTYEYLDPTTGVLTLNTPIGSEGTRNVEQGSAAQNNIYIKGEFFNTYDIDDLEINDNYESIFKDYGCHHENAQQNVVSTERLNFSNKSYHQMNTGTTTTSSLGPSSLMNSPTNPAMVNMGTPM